MTTTYPITGIQKGLGPNGEVPLRREIDEWWFSKKIDDFYQRSLFILALREFMSMEPHPENPKDLSYFSIAGIHGLPLKPWDATTEKAEWYCAHRSVTFPTWHTPYMLLFEQRLYEIMLELIPKNFSDVNQAVMIRAAETWRLPYWDWAAKKPTWDKDDPDNPNNRGPNFGLNVPFVLTQTKVIVRTDKSVDGYLEVDNPLWRFKLPATKIFNDYGVGDSKGRLYSQAQATSRHATASKPDEKEFKEAWVLGNQNNWSKITSELRGSKVRNGNTLPERVYRLFAYKPTYPDFGQVGWNEGQQPERYGSLEEIHNNLHGLVGGSGQMRDPSVSAFDPVFWLHHCNIDRLLATWLELNEDQFSSWLKSDSKAKDALAPFHQNADGLSWTSIKCSYKPKDLGYAYSELQPWLDKYKTNGQFDKAKYQADIRANIRLKYATTPNSILLLPRYQEIARALMASMTKENINIQHLQPPLIKLAEKLAAEGEEAAGTPAEDWSEPDYVVNVVYDRFALGGQPYSVRIFLGDVPRDSISSFENTPTQVGMVYNFSSTAEGRGVGPEGCDNCKNEEINHLRSSGQIPITDYLVENITKERSLDEPVLQSLDRDEVVPYLKENLHWRILDENQNVVSPDDMNTLMISVAVGKATHYTEAAQFSEYGPYETLYDVTENRPGGVTSAAELGL